MPKPTSTIVKLTTGNRGRRPLPKRAAPVASGSLGRPPEHLSELEQSIWREIARGLPVNVATASDRPLFELLIKLFAKVRSDPDALTPALTAQVRQLCIAFMMSPADRWRYLPPGYDSSGIDAAAAFFDREAG